MSTFTVRNPADAWQAMQLLCAEGGEHIKIRFENYFLTVDASSPIDGMRSAEFFIALQRAIRHEHCMVKYGKRSLRGLTEQDRRDTKVGVSYHPENTRIVYDLTGALNARAKAVEDWDERGPIGAERTQSLIAGSEKEEGKNKESWPRTARELGLAYIRKSGARDLRTIGLAAVLAAAMAHALPNIVYEGLTFVAERWDASAAHQYRMAMKDRTTIVTFQSRDAKLGHTELAKMEHEVDGARARTRALISDNIEQPLVRFVVAEAESVRPALLDMAPKWGTITINGAAMNGETARAGAKLLRKAAKSKRDNGGWVTQTVPASKA